MTTDIRDYLGRELLFYDGGTGTYLQSHGLAAGELPESCNLACRREMVQMHESFLEAGCNILLTNTFGANPGKLAGSGWEPEEPDTGRRGKCQRGGSPVPAETGSRPSSVCISGYWAQRTADEALWGSEF